MVSQYKDCTQIGPNCPVEGSTYGYYPSLAANGFFIGFFALFFVLNAGLGYWYKTWTYALGLCLATATEAIGYGGRIMLHSNPYDNTGFIIQICCIIIAPAFNSASLYLTLKYICLTFGEQSSRIKPWLYTWIFIGGDLISLILQGAGGGIASGAKTDSLLKTGDNFTMAGISWQVFTLLAFALVTLDYAIRRARSPVAFTPHASAMLADPKFQIFAAAMATAWVTIFVRCVYRIIEFAGGWANSTMQNQTLFIVLEGVMIVIATTAQTLPHPGYCFPALSSRTQPFVPKDLKTIEHRVGDNSISSQDTLTETRNVPTRDQEK